MVIKWWTTLSEHSLYRHDLLNSAIDIYVKIDNHRRSLICDRLKIIRYNGNYALVKKYYKALLFWFSNRKNPIARNTKDVGVICYRPECKNFEMFTKFKRCSRCKYARYCSQECQQLDTGHKCICDRVCYLKNAGYPKSLFHGSLSMDTRKFRDTGIREKMANPTLDLEILLAWTDILSFREELHNKICSLVGTSTPIYVGNGVCVEFTVVNQS